MGWWTNVTGAVLLVALVAACTTEASPPRSSPVTLGATEVVRPDDVVRYGVSSSPSSPWAHYRTSCDTSCSLVFGAVTDTLFATAADGETIGLLVESFESNVDHTIHTWRLREGISFSDGSALDAAAVKINIDACRFSPLTGPGLAGIDDVRADGSTLTITSLAPWATLPVHFAETPCGHVFSARWLETLPDLPQRTTNAPFFDPDIAARPPIGDTTRPIGLGPFTMDSFTPGNGNSAMMVRNPAYWRGQNGITGETLPRLDEIELVVVADNEIRATALETGQFDIFHTLDPLSQGEPAPLPGVDTFTSAAFADTAQVVLNAADVDGNPLRYLSCRRAVVAAIDVPALTSLLGQPAPAVGPFAPGVLGHDPSRTVESFDPTAAGQWAQRCFEDTGAPTLGLLTAPGDPRASIVEEMIERASSDSGFGAIEIEIEELDPAALGVAALLGEFDLLLWDNHGGVHPDLGFEWWYSEASAPIGSFATNVGRLEDPATDRALVGVRRSERPTAVARSAAEIQQAFDANAATAWLYWTAWTVGAGPAIDLELSRTTPEGIELVPMINGAHDLAIVGFG